MLDFEMLKLRLGLLFRGDLLINFFFHKERQTDVLFELTHPLPKIVTEKIDMKIESLTSYHVNPLDSCVT